MIDPIRHNHPDLKGSFTALGNWYNVLNKASMKSLYEILAISCPSDKAIARKEIGQANRDVFTWKEKPYLKFLYEEYKNQNRC